MLAKDQHAVMYENVNARKVKEFLTVLRGLRGCEAVIQCFRGVKLRRLLKRW